MTMALAASSAAIILAILLYWNRPQKIDFGLLFPVELNHCGRNLNIHDPQYEELLHWFKTHQDDWRHTPATYVPQNTYSSETFMVNIMKKGVIVNYRDSNGNWRQMKHDKMPAELNKDCSDTGTSLSIGAPVILAGPLPT